MKKKLNTLKLLASIATSVDSLLNEVVNADKQSTTSSTKVDFEKIKANAQERHKQIKDQVTTLVSNVKENDEVNELMKMVRELKDTIATNNDKVVAEAEKDVEPKKEASDDITYHLISTCERSNEALQRGQAINVLVTKDSMLADGHNPDYAEEAFMYLKKLFGINLSASKLYITVLSEIANMPSHYVVVVNGKVFTGVYGIGFYVENLEDFD